MVLKYHWGLDKDRCSPLFVGGPLSRYATWEQCFTVYNTYLSSSGCCLACDNTSNELFWGSWLFSGHWVEVAELPCVKVAELGSWASSATMFHKAELARASWATLPISWASSPAELAQASWAMRASWAIGNTSFWCVSTH